MHCIDRTSGASLRAVFDTNVLLDFWVFDDAAARPLIARLECGAIEAVTSRACIDELADVLGRIELGVSAETRQSILARWFRIATPIEPTRMAELICKDPDDQKFLDLAQAADAAWLFTRDRALLELAPSARRFGLRIEQPADLLSVEA